MYTVWQSVKESSEDSGPLYVVKVQVPDNVLARLTLADFITFRDIKAPWVLLGFTNPDQVTYWRDPRECCTTYIIQTNEVVKPSLFGQALPYTAEAL